MNTEINAIKNGAGIFNKTLFVRGNHDNTVAGSATAWENYFSSQNRPLPAGVTNYAFVSSTTQYLTYSFDYGNSRFIGLDVPGDVVLLNTEEYNFLERRLSDATNQGLTHAFIFFHGPEYCVESTHCTCTTKNNGSCTPAALIQLINQYPIVSATIHGHEHILGWVHMDSSRVSSLTHPYEEFFTSPSGANTYNSKLYPARVDYADVAHEARAYATITVNGSSFTVNLFRVGINTPVWSHTFTK
jgi:hypothetical protein